MKLVIPTMLSVAFCLALSACAHPHHGVEAKQERSEIPEGYRVSIGSKEIKDGDRVNVFRPNCRNIPGSKGTSTQSCSDEKVGEALVLKVLDHDLAIVRPDGTFAMDTTMTVEKKK